MPTPRAFVLAGCLLIALAARADDASQPLPAVVDVIYMGVVGKALDVVPMDPEERVILQRTSAVVSGTFTGRSLMVWAGLTNPILIVVGLAWGLYSASNITVVEAGAKPDTNRGEPPAPVEAGPTRVALWLGLPPEEAKEAMQ